MSGMAVKGTEEKFIDAANQELLWSMAEKLNVYLNAISYLNSLKKSAEYYLSFVEQEKQPTHITLIAAKENALSAIQRINKLKEELIKNSEKWDAQQIKEFTLVNSKTASEPLSKTKELLDDYIKRSPGKTFSSELTKNIGEALPVVGGALTTTSAYLDYEKAVKEGRDASLERITLYAVGALSMLPLGALAARHGIRYLRRANAIRKLLGVEPTAEILRMTDDFVKQIPKKIADDLAKARNSIPLKSGAIELIHNFNTNIDEVVKRFPKMEELKGDAAVYVLDKSKTWQLNNIGWDVGDLGLTIYFEAMKKLEKMGAYVARTTAIGDEVVILGKKGLEKNIQKALMESAEETFRKYGLKDTLGLKEICSKASVLSANVIVKNGEILYNIRGKEKLFNISGLINDIELEHSLRWLSERNKKVVLGFVDSLQRIKNMPTTANPSKNGMKVLLEFYDQKMLRALEEIAESSGKAVHQVGTNSIGPSTVNMLGHVNADKITAAVIDTLVESGKITKEEAAKILQRGALSYSIESPEIAQKLARLNGQEITAVIGNTKVKMKFFTGAENAIKNATNMHILKKMGMSDEKAELILAYAKHIDSTIAKLHLAGEALPPWARDTLGLLYYYIEY